MGASVTESPGGANGVIDSTTDLRRRAGLACAVKDGIRAGEARRPLNRTEGAAAEDVGIKGAIREVREKSTRGEQLTPRLGKMQFAEGLRSIKQIVFPARRF